MFQQKFQTLGNHIQFSIEVNHIINQGPHRWVEADNGDIILDQIDGTLYGLFLFLSLLSSKSSWLYLMIVPGRSYKLSTSALISCEVKYKRFLYYSFCLLLFYWAVTTLIQLLKCKWTVLPFILQQLAEFIKQIWTSIIFLSANISFSNIAPPTEKVCVATLM